MSTELTPTAETKFPPDARVGYYPESVVVAMLLFAEKIRAFKPEVDFEMSIENFTPLAASINAFGTKHSYDRWKDIIESIVNHERIQDQSRELCLVVKSNAEFFYAPTASNMHYDTLQYGKWTAKSRHGAAEYELHIDPINKDIFSTQNDFLIGLQYMSEKMHSATFTATSWLLSTESSNHIFPKKFLRTRIDDSYVFSRGILWFQFITADLSVQENRLSEFLTKINTANTYDELIQAFPCWPCYIQGTIAELHEIHSTHIKKLKAKYPERFTFPK